MKVLVPAAAIAASLLLALTSRPAQAQDFSCREARTAAERTICATPALKSLDERMARVYGWVWDATPNHRREALRNDQRLFLAERDACDTSRRCLERSYLERIGILTGRLASAPRRSRFE